MGVFVTVGFRYPRSLPRHLRLSAQRTLVKLKHQTFRRHQRLVGLRRARPSLAIRKVDWPLSEMAIVLWFQMCGLETISTTRCNGRGPDGSLKMVWAFVQTRVYTVQPYGQSPIITIACIRGSLTSKGLDARNGAQSGFLCGC